MSVDTYNLRSSGAQESGTPTKPGGTPRGKKRGPSESAESASKKGRKSGKVVKGKASADDDLEDATLGAQGVKAEPDHDSD